MMLVCPMNFKPLKVWDYVGFIAQCLMSTFNHNLMV